MDKQGLLYVIAAAAGLWAAVVVGRLLVVWLRLMRMRFGPGGMEPADRSGMPADIAAILDPVAARLAALGFAYEETVLVQPVLRGGDPESVWTDSHVHSASGSRAKVQVADSPEPGSAAAVSFITQYADRIVETENRRAHLLFPVPADCEVEDAGAATLAEHWAFHCRRLQDTSGPVVTDSTELGQRHREFRAALFDHWQQSGFMRRIGDDWRLTARGAWRYLRQVMAGNRRMAALPPRTEVEDPQVRLLADVRAWRTQEALLQHNGMSRQGKVLWFAVSAMAGAAAFAYMSSWEIVPVLLGILLFHEFGHALAMRAVGYRGLSVLVLPFLGAVAIGRKDDAGPWQKLVVLLAGPLPGLVLAVVCLRLGMADTAHSDLLTTVGAMALGINLFNLLPFTPLDGGQMVDTFLFCRRPRLRFAFFAMSAMALVAVGLALESTVLAAAGLLLALSIPSAWRSLRLLAGLDPVVGGADPVVAILKRLHEGPGPRWPAFAQRVQTVRALLPLVRGRVPTFLESVGGLSAYLAAIALPVGLLWDTGLPHQAFAELTRPSAVSYRAPEPPDWMGQLARATTAEARWKVLWDAGQWFEENEDEAQALQRYEEAVAEATNLPRGPESELHLLDTRIAVARVSEPDVSRQSYVALLPALRRLPAAERWRTADVLIALDRLDTRAQPQERIARLREAVAMREVANFAESSSLLDDRLELARLLDSTGDTSGAEVLLQKNLEVLARERGEFSPWQLEPVAWFYIVHGRAAEAETLLVAHSKLAENTNRRVLQTLAWAQLAQGKAASVQEVFREQLEMEKKRKSSGWQRLTLVVDLAHASADVPEEEARWLQEATELKAAMGKEFRSFRRYVRNEAESGAWENSRGRARLEVLKRLPGGAEEQSEDSVKMCH